MSGSFVEPTEFWGKLPVVFDGAISTELYNRGCPFEEIPEVWAASNPATLEEIHSAYLSAGAGVATTATFGLFRLVYTEKLSVDDAASITRANLRACRRAVGERALIGGSIGPTARQAHQIDETLLASSVEPIVSALADNGADFILLETQTSLREALALAGRIRQLCQLPLVVSYGFAWHGRTLDDFTPAQAVEEMLRFQPVALGCNCAPDSVGMVRILQQMAPVADDIPILLRPNAGIPETVNGRKVYSISPQRMGDLVITYFLDGARLIGGCCGSTPAHIAAVSERLSYRSAHDDAEGY